MGNNNPYHPFGWYPALPTLTPTLSSSEQAAYLKGVEDERKRCAQIAHDYSANRSISVEHAALMIESVIKGDVPLEETW
jgi:hypothetical protein